MTNKEALEHAKECLEVHLISAELNPSVAERENELAEYCRVIIDVFEKKTSTGDITKTLTALKQELYHNKKMLAECGYDTIHTKYDKEYKRVCDWYSCCVKALEEYLFEFE